jgi:hypothetical protein
MLMVFFDSQCILHKQFVKEGCTVNAEYYKGVLVRLISRIRRVHMLYVVVFLGSVTVDCTNSALQATPSQSAGESRSPT